MADSDLEVDIKDPRSSVRTDAKAAALGKTRWEGDSVRYKKKLYIVKKNEYHEVLKVWNVELEPEGWKGELAYADQDEVKMHVEGPNNPINKDEKSK